CLTVNRDVSGSFRAKSGGGSQSNWPAASSPAASPSAKEGGLTSRRRSISLLGLPAVVAFGDGRGGYDDGLGNGLDCGEFFILACGISVYPSFVKWLGFNSPRRI
ncbi:hypothetical protein EJB05_08981, partial [Eragrostis curvula]